MTHAYDEEYVDLAQRILGDAFDFAVVTLGMDADEFANCFITSGVASRFEEGNPGYVAGITGCELVRKVFAEHNMEIAEVEDAMFLDKSPEYWAGWAGAFYQWYTSNTFKEIFSMVPASEIIDMYPIYHEMDIMQFVHGMDVKMGRMI